MLLRIPARLHFVSVPDPRFHLANERTFLAWIRTALGLVAGAAALEAIDLPWPEVWVRALAAVLALTAVACIGIAFGRWQRVDRAIAEGGDARIGGSHLVPAVGVIVVAVAVLLLVLFG